MREPRRRLRFAAIMVLLTPSTALAVPATSRPAASPAEKPAAGGPGASTSPPAEPKVGAPVAAGGELESTPTTDKALYPAVKTEGKLRRPERAVIGLELAGGVAIPFKNYLSFGSGTNQYYMENGLGGGVALSLTLNHVELRWAYSALSTGRVVGRIPDEALAGLQLIDKQMGGTGQIPAQIDKEANGTLTMNAITLGYRLTFEPSRRVHVVVPLGVGVVATQPPSFGLLSYTLYGFAADVGLRGEVLLAKILALGLDTRFSIYVTEPDANLGAAGYAATKNAFDAAVAWLPMLSVGLYARVYY